MSGRGGRRPELAVGRPVGRPALRIPLRFRLPNAPARFVGRAAERAHLSAALARAPLAVVSGLGGMGKTALALSVLHGELAEVVPRALFVGVRPGEPTSQLLLEVARALGAATRDRPPDWDRFGADPDQALEMVLDLAEEAGAWILLDDAHHGELGPTRELLADIRRYARRSRWLATSRTILHGPELDLAGQQIVLGPMAVDDLAELARCWSPGLDAERGRRLAAAAAGSPWQLRVSLGDVAASGGRHDLTAGLDREALDLVHLLAVLDVAFPPEEIEAVTPAPPAKLEDLERRGLLERTPAGVRLHDLTRSLLSVPEGLRAAWTRRAADALSVSRVPAAWVEALRLWLQLGAPAEALRLLDARGDGALEAGYAPRLFHLLADAGDERLARWRFRVAVELGRPGPLARIAEPASSAPADRLLWARALYGRGEALAAARVAGEVLAAPEAPAALRYRAGLLQLHVFFIVCEPERMAEVLATLPVSTAEERANADAYGALCRLLLGDGRAAGELAERIVRELPALPPRARSEVGARIAIVAFFLGRTALGDAALTRATGAGADLAFPHNARMLRLVGADLAIVSGRLADLRELRAQLEANPALQRTHWAYVEFVIVLHGMFAGELAGLDERSAALAARMHEALPGRWLESWALFWAARLDTARGRRAPAPSSHGFPAPRPQALDVLDLARLENRVRHGDEVAPVPDEAVEAFVDLARVFAGMVAGQMALVRGEVERALGELAAAIRTADELGARPYAAEARALRCEALLCAARGTELRVAAAELDALAREIGSPRFAGEARFYNLAVEDRVPRPWELEALAGQRDVAPVAARRARALLGENAPLDRLDARVVDAIQRAAAPWRVELVCGGAGGSGFGLDGHRHELWAANGRHVALAGQPLLWRCLEALAELGGAAPREELFRRVWGEAGYHPLRHKSRLNTTISRLRNAIEDHPDAPALLLTTEEGYRFGGGAVRWLRARGAM